MLDSVRSIQDCDQIYSEMSHTPVEMPSSKLHFGQAVMGPEEDYIRIEWLTKKSKDMLTVEELKSLFVSQAHDILRTVCAETVVDESDLSALLKEFESEVVSGLSDLSNAYFKEMDCTHCLRILCEPVTLTCGHSICKKCLDKAMTCPICNIHVTSSTSLSVNILLSAILKKYDVGESTKIPLSDKHLSTIRNDSLRKAISKYSSLLTSADGSSGKLVSKCVNLSCSIFSLNNIKKGAVPMLLQATALKRKRESSLEYTNKSKRLATASNRWLFPRPCDFSRIHRSSWEKESDHSKTSKIWRAADILGIDEESKVLAAAEHATMPSAEEPFTASDFECSLCMSLYHEPVCAPCGHSFCKDCLERCLDHNAQCPLCREPIERDSLSFSQRRPSVDVTAQAFIKHHFRKEYEERLKQHQTEIQKLGMSVPIFVCTIAFPAVACLLHVYEPRYRLMLRRVMDIHKGEFGMCAPSPDKPFHKIGTILRVRSVSCLHDGRSIVDSIGMRRFEVANCSACDGYNTAQIKYISDETVEQKTEVSEINKLIDLVYSHAEQWLQAVDVKLKEKIVDHFGELPSKDYTQGPNGPDWTWWIITVLPLGDGIKLSLLGKRHLRERLVTILKILTCLKKRS